MVVSAFGFQNESEARQYKHNPIDLLEPLAKAKVPLLHVSGNADFVVPLEENTAVLEQRYKALGGDISLIIKNGIGHKHGLEDPTPIIQFVLKHTLQDPVTVVPPFQDGDVVSFIGDSITHSRKWHKYVSDYYLTRFPEKSIQFLNAGLSGDSASGALRRLDHDILPRKPNVAVIMLGMNDVSRNLYEPGAVSEENLAARRKSLDHYKASMTQLVDKLSKNGIKRFVFVTSSPFDDTAHIAAPNLPGVNDALRQTRAILHELAVSTGGALAEFQAPMTELNLERQKKDPAYTLIGSDRVHPLDPGVLVMAYLFLKSQDAPAIVSKIMLPAKDGTGECIRCQMSAITRTDGTWAFDVSEASLPFPLEESAKDALSLVPIEAQLNQEVLTFAGAPPGRFRLLIDGIQIDEYPSEALRRGVNLAFDARTPQYAQAQQVSALNEERRKLAVSLRDVVKVEETIIRRRDISLDDPKVKEALAAFINKLRQTNATSLDYYTGLVERYYTLKAAVPEMQKQIQSLTKRLREINQPHPHHFELQTIPNP
jgi:lysophospholipase L1-like esterase